MMADLGSVLVLDSRNLDVPVVITVSVDRTFPGSLDYCPVLVGALDKFRKGLLEALLVVWIVCLGH